MRQNRQGGTGKDSEYVREAKELLTIPSMVFIVLRRE
jgi:hypothetical protein